IPRGLKPKEETFQVVLEALALTPCYPAFLITTDVHEICPRVPGCDFDALPSEEDTVSFLRDLGHTGVINSLNDVVIDQMHQPWRTFAAIINRSLSGKTSGLDKLRLSRAKILWGMYHQKFKIDKKKRFKLTLEVFRDIFQICPKVPGRDFDALPSKEDTISFLRDLGHTRVINSLNDVVIDQMHQPWRTFAAIINRTIWKASGLTNIVFPRHKSFGACTIRSM
ncbi:hypothetical protein Tco_0737023, partial [Tanacetum coccineum]